MNTKILGAACTVTSSLKVEDLEKLKKFSPKSLSLRDPETKSDVFKIAYDERCGSVSAYGISFDSQNTEGFAQITFPIPTEITAENREQFIKDNIGLSLMNLANMETAITAELLVLNEKFDKIGENITTLG